MPFYSTRAFSEETGTDSFKKGSPLSSRKCGKRSRDYAKRIQDEGNDNQKVINHVRSLLSRIPVPVRQEIVSCSNVSPYSGLTYQQLAEHVISLRTEYIQKLARPIVLKFYTHPRNFNIFNEPVDPILHNLPHYFECIKNPMDLGTIKCRLNSSYYENLSHCFDDIRLVFNNAIIFNGQESFVGKAAKDMLAEFEADVGDLEDKNNRNSTKKCSRPCCNCSDSMCLLCGEKCLKLENTSFFCQGSCAQKIKKGGIYFVSKDALNVWCQKCHQSLPPVLGTYLDPDAKLPLTLLKKDLLKRRHDEQTTEPWVECDRCGYWLHQICALYTDSSVHHEYYFCPICVLEEAANTSRNALHIIPATEPEITRDIDSVASHTDRDTSSVETSTLSPYVQRLDERFLPLTAKSLPKTRLSEFLEGLVKELLFAYDFDDSARSISIRVTSNIERNIEVNVPLQQFSRQLYGADLPTEIPYRQKCIQLYQEIDGVSVVLFSLYVHEFDEKCPAPNTSTVYIAYLDSTDYFRPAQMRSFVYQEIVVGYLLWSRARGFKQCHIWACPPQRGDNFIFWCHPSHQRTPSRDRLNAWYNSILARTRKLGVHQGVEHLWNTFFAHLPCRNSETSTREASKRSHSTLATTAAAMPRKYSKSNKGNRTTATTCTDSNSEECKPEVKVFPPIFEGDYWILELTRFYQNSIQRWKNAGQQSVQHSKTCRNVLRTLWTSPLSVPFREPVNPVLLKIPTYFEIVHQPMDLGTVRERLESNKYETVFDFVTDVRRTFGNAMLFNPVGHPIHNNADSLLKDFERRMSDVCAESRKLQNLTRLDNSCPLSDDELLQRCKLAPITQPVAPSIPTTLETLVEDQNEPPMTPGSRRSKRNREGLVPEVCVKIEKDPISSSQKKELQRSAAQQSPTSVFEGRQEELFLCDPKKLARAVSDDICTPVQQLNTWRNPCSNDSETFAVTAMNIDVSDNIEQQQTSIRDNEEVSSPLINTSAVAALSAIDGSIPTICVSSFTADLSKSIQRLNDDLFVVRFPHSAESLISNLSEDGQQQKLIAPGVGGKSRKISNMFVPRQAMQLLQDIPHDTSDPDPLMENALVDSRHTFLEMSQFRHMQFDTLRRAKHSSRILLYHQLHKCNKQCGPVCSHCGERIQNLRWHCELCAGFEICHSCMLNKESLRLLEKNELESEKKLNTTLAVKLTINNDVVENVSASKLKKKSKNLCVVVSAKRETRRRDSQLTRRREDDTFVYTPIISTQRQHRQQLDQQQHQPKSIPTSICHPDRLSLPHPRSQGVLLACNSADPCEPEVFVNDFGVFPGHTHPLTPYRVTYM